MKNNDDVYSNCCHPDHNENESCADRAVGCSKHCLCCMEELAIPLKENEKQNTPMKSKGEIVVETLLHYNLESRGYNRAGGYCTYLDKSTGNKCAVGRCILDSEIEKVSEYEREQINQNDGSPGVAKLVENFNDLDYLLSPEYRGHDVEFWKSLQYLHDLSRLWTEDGFNATASNISFISISFGEEIGEAVQAAFAE